MRVARVFFTIIALMVGMFLGWILGMMLTDEASAATERTAVVQDILPGERSGSLWSPSRDTESV